MRMSVSLHYQDAKSDKVYHINIEKGSGGYVVNFQFGRRGGTLQKGTKTSYPVSLEKASAILEQLVVEKQAKGYQEIGMGIQEAKHIENGYPVEEPIVTARTPYPAELLEETNEEQAVKLLTNDDYILQIKFDGKRIQVQREGSKITCYNKLGQIIPAHPNIEKAVLALPVSKLFLDGELVDGFYIAFDLLSVGGKSIADWTYQNRYLKLLDLPETEYFKVSPIAVTTFQKNKTLTELKARRAEGGVFKLKTAVYRPGRNGSQKKFKFWKTLSAIVLEVKVNGKDSIKLGLIENGKMVEVGRCTSLGKAIPGVGGIVEVKYLYATAEKKLYQPEIKEIRDDVSRKECTTSQLVFKQGIGK